MLDRLYAPIRQILFIVMGTFIYAFGIHYFVIPNELMEGGVTGIALLLNYALQIPPSLTTLALNIPLFYIGLRIFGIKSMFLTMLGTISLSLFLWILEIFIVNGWIEPFQSMNDHFLATLYAGLTTGVGLGIVFGFGGTTGGGDIIARIGNKLRGWSMGQVILTIDTIVISSSIFYIPREKIMYTLVLVFIASRVIDFIQKGAYAAKAFTIITEKAPQVAKSITAEIDHGVTLFQARGGYSRQAKEVIYCIVYRHETRKLNALVRKSDPRAFIVIHDVQDVLGEGFKLE